MQVKILSWNIYKLVAILPIYIKITNIRSIYYETYAKLLKPFQCIMYQPNVSFPYHLKASENQWLSDVFKEHEKGTLRRNGLNI